MTERMTLLNNLKQQLDNPELRCNPYGDCWCMQISFIFDTPMNETCLSPQEILDVARQWLSTNEQEYLESLVDKKFIK